MVLKRSKFGINSGNSFGGYRFNEQRKRGAMQNASFAITYSIPYEEYTANPDSQKLDKIAARRVARVLSILGFRDDRAASRLGALDSNSAEHRIVRSTVTMSLNKKGRWKIADALIDAIQSDTFGPPVKREDASNIVKETSREKENFGKRKKRAGSKKTSKRERNDCLDDDNDATVLNRLDCGVSLAQFGVPGVVSSRYNNDYQHKTSFPSSCAVYANSDTVRRVVYPSDRNMKQSTSRAYIDFRDALNRAYDGALVRDEENSEDTNESTVRTRSHNTLRRHRNRGFQRLAMPVRKSKPRRHCKHEYWHSKNHFEYLRPIKRCDVRFSVVEPRQLTTEPCFRKAFVTDTDTTASSKTSRSVRSMRRKHLLELNNELDCMMESEYDYEYETEEILNLAQLNDDSAWPVDDTDSYNSSLSIDFATNIGDFDSGIEPDLSEAESIDVLSAMQTSACKQNTYNLLDFVVRQAKRPGHKKTKRTHVNPEDLETAKSVRIEVMQELAEPLSADASSDETVIETEYSINNKEDSDTTTAGQVEKLWERLVAEREHGTSMRLAFCATQLDSTLLDSQFGDRYYESESMPRCVMLELGDEADVKHMKANLLISVEIAQKSNKDAEQVTVDEDVVWASVRLNVSTDDETASKIMHRFAQLGSQYGSVSDVALFYLQVYDLVHSTRSPTVTSSVKTYGRMWRKQDGVASVSSLTHVPIQLPKGKTQLCKDALTTMPMECGICMSEPVGAVELGKCGHVFCTECIARYTIGQTAATTLRSASIECPAYKCSTGLDAATVCSLLPSTAYFSYLRRLAELEVSRHTDGHVWCPNSKCALLLRREDRGATRTHRSNTQTGGTVESDMHCAQCDAHFCFDCGFEAHFPATCEDRQVFAAKLVQRNQETKRVESEFSYSLKRHEAAKNDAYLAMVKHCPRCRLVMEKGEGCMHMTCRCGHQFCWVCLGDWVDHCRPDFVWDCESRSFDFKIVELSNSTSTTAQKRERFFQSAILYRSAYLEQSERLCFIRSLQTAFDSSTFARDASTHQVADGNAALEATERLLESVGLANEMLVESLRFMCFINATTFVYRSSEKNNKTNAKRMKKPRAVYWAVKKLDEPLEALRFGLVLVNELCKELLKSETIKVSLQLGSQNCLREFATSKVQQKVTKLIQLTNACQQQLCRSRSLASFIFECIRW